MEAVMYRLSALYCSKHISSTWAKKRTTTGGLDFTLNQRAESKNKKYNKSQAQGFGIRFKVKRY